MWVSQTFPYRITYQKLNFLTNDKAYKRQKSYHDISHICISHLKAKLQWRNQERPGMPFNVLSKWEKGSICSMLLPGKVHVRGESTTLAKTPWDISQNANWRSIILKWEVIIPSSEPHPPPPINHKITMRVERGRYRERLYVGKSEVSQDFWPRL